MAYKSQPSNKHHHHGGAICYYSGMAMANQPTPPWGGSAEGLGLGSGLGLGLGLGHTHPPPAKPYSMMTLDGYVGKPYTHRFVDFVEVDIHVAGPLPEHAYKVELCENGTTLIWRRAIPDFFLRVNGW